MRLQQEKAYTDFISTIAKSKDLDTVDKLRILLHVSDEMKGLGENLGYLECQQLLKELRATKDLDRNI
jgi:hypothetical protein